MSLLAKAEILSKKELFVGFRFAEFQYRHYNDGKKLESSSFKLVTKDYDFELVWTIICAYASQGSETLVKWTDIKLPESDRNFFGNYEIKLSTSRASVKKEEFDTDSLPLDRPVALSDYCRPGSYIVIKVQVHWADDRLSVMENYDRLFETKDSSDVMFIIDEEEIPACKNILSAHSEVFSKMFEADMIEKKTSRVLIPDIDPEIFKLLLRFIYCGKLDCNDSEELLKLSMAANKYEVRSLVNLCGYRISNNLTPDNAVEAMHVADQVRNEFLKEDCMDFIIKNKDKVVDTESFKRVLVESRADLLADIFRRIKCV